MKRLQLVFLYFQSHNFPLVFKFSVEVFNCFSAELFFDEEGGPVKCNDSGSDESFLHNLL